MGYDSDSGDELDFGPSSSDDDHAARYCSSNDDDSTAADDDASASDYNDFENDSRNNAKLSTNTKKRKQGNVSTTTKALLAKKKKIKTKSSTESSPSPPARQRVKTVEEIYQKKTQLEHILLRPDTYIGSIEPLTQPMFILDDDSNQIVQREITYTPGFYKIFDEIVVNAADNKQRDPTMDRLEIDVDSKRGVISVLNNGKSIPVVQHKEHGCYVPTLIFGHLLTVRFLIVIGHDGVLNRFGIVQKSNMIIHNCICNPGIQL
jgi:hypothetical protein